MNEHSSVRASGSLLERAAEKFDFGAALRGPATEQPADPAPPPGGSTSAPASFAPTPPQPAPSPAPSGPVVEVDRARLVDAGYVLPDMRPDALAEEFRIVKRQLLLRASGEAGESVENGKMILVASAKPGEGKTFCAINLALSMARETDLDVVLADCDFSKPDIFDRFGIEEGPGLIDALADRSVDVNSCLVRTDLSNLSLLAPGRHTDDAPELLASGRTREVLDRLVEARPRRIVVVDSPPALSASTAAELAMRAGQAVMVVRADATSEEDLREALGLLGRCRHIQLLLNAVTFAPHGKRFGDYYGYGE